MKTLISKYWLVLMALVSVTLFTACSSDDDDAVTPVFPQVQTIAGAAGYEPDLHPGRAGPGGIRLCE